MQKAIHGSPLFPELYCDYETGELLLYLVHGSILKVPLERLFDSAF